jgi:hypothetical protein
VYALRVGVDGRFWRMSGRDADLSSGDEAEERRTEDLSIGGIRPNTVHDREGELALGEVFGKAFVGLILCTKTHWESSLSEGDRR